MRKSTLVLNCTPERVINCFDRNIFLNLLPISTPSRGVFLNESPFRVNREIYFRKGFFDPRVAQKRKAEIHKLIEAQKKPSISKLRIRLMSIFNQ